MKYLAILVFLLTTNLCAQIEYGTITYLKSSEIRMPIDEENPSPQDKQIREMMAKMQASGAFNKTFHATFSPEAFNCVEQSKAPAEQSTESGGATVVIMTSDADPKHFYTNVATGEITNTDLIFDRKFLVTGTPEPIEWELTGEKIAPDEMTSGLDLLVAKGEDSDGNKLVAGYATSLPVQVGPLNYHGLPGAIITLEVSKGKSTTVYRATSIELSQEPVTVARPSGGKAISLEKFTQARKKRQKQQRTIRRTIRQ